MTVELDDFSQYAAARWETLVRASVLLGLPPSAAQPLAVEAIARARGGPDGTESGHDPDVDLFGELVEGHRNDRRRWWLGTPTSADVESREALASVEGELDRLTPAARERVVLRAVAWLPPTRSTRSWQEMGIVRRPTWCLPWPGPRRACRWARST